MTNSMTAVASRTGVLGNLTWAWDIRSVNARGLDLRLRIPDSLDGLEAHLRKTLGAALARGNVTLNLRLAREEGASTLSVDPAQLDVVLQALDQVQERAFEMGVTLAQPNAADVLNQRGVLTTAKTERDDADLIKALTADFEPLLAALQDMRGAEGAALHQVVTVQIDEIETLVADAAHAANARKPAMEKTLKTALQRVAEAVDFDQPRIAQELALIAVKADVTEEIDRLIAHIAAARALLASDGPIGRKLDFLSQEFNREANTLCAKAGSPALTAIGLSLKSVIDQMREQIQNVE